jgi:hypothetical protein
MNNPTEKPRQVVDRFLGKLSEPLSPSQVDSALGRVRERLGEPEALAFSDVASAKRVSVQWSAVAAVILALVIGGAVQRVLLTPEMSAHVAKGVGGEVYLAGQWIRAGVDASTIEMLDGSRIEMSPQTVLSIVPASDGMSVQLNAGTVIVTAAKQRHGHLYVKTKDLVVSVVGTVFSVSAETSGSRVSVIEGKVRVQQGPTDQMLLPGQQASTSPALGPLPVETELKWSKQAPELVALLQQSTPATPAPAPTSQTPLLSIHGTVKLASKGEPVQGVDVIVCPSSAAAFAAGRAAYASSSVSGQFRVQYQQPLDPATPTNSDPVTRDKTFFFALWDGQCPSPLARAKTDATGRFQLKDLAAGEYVVRAQLEGYFGPVTSGSYPQFASQMVTLDPQQSAPDVTLFLVRGGTISGRVRDGEGKVVANMNVSAGVMAGTVSNSLSFLAAKSTDDRGEYRLFSLPPGEYFVVAGSGAAAWGTGVIRFYSSWSSPGPGASALPNLTFFPSAAMVNDATPIVLKEGEDISNIDIALRPPMPTDAPVRPFAVPTEKVFSSTRPR